jgi:non-homologous end joining protein Ku
MIESKQQGQEIAAVQHPKLAPVIDLMEALKKSIAEKQPATSGGKKPPVRTAPAPAAQTEAPAQKRARRSSGG